MRQPDRRQFYLRGIQSLLTLLVVSSLLLSCQFPPKQSDPNVSDSKNVPVGEKTPVSLPEPRQDLPPALVEVSPLPGSVIDLKQPFTFYFNQAMDAISVEAAIRFDPLLSGTFTWDQDQILTFLPDESLPPNTDLTIAFNTSAQADNGLTLLSPVELAFTTADHLRLTQVVPSDQSTEVDPEGAIFVAFNQPAVALGADDEASAAFTLSPSAPGEGRWLNTSTYIFYPEPSLAAGTKYTIEIEPNLKSLAGAKLDLPEGGAYTFSTTHPELSAIEPPAGEKLSLDGEITLHFNVRMDAQSVEENFGLLAPNGERVPGKLEWAEDLRSATFISDEPLMRDETYLLSLTTDAETMGGLSLERGIETTRKTYPALMPADQDKPEFDSYYGNYGQYSVTFDTPIEKTSFKKFVTITPAIGAENVFLSNDDATLAISGYFAAETTYTLTLDAGLRDRWGGPSGQLLTFSFTTPPAPASLNVRAGTDGNNLVFVPADVSALSLQATNINTLTLKTAPITFEDLLTLIHPDNYDYRQMFTPDAVEKSTLNFNLPRNRNQVVTVALSYQGNPLTPGIYYLELSSPDISEESYNAVQKFFVVVSHHNLVFKVDPSQALVWATRLDNLNPLSDEPIAVYSTDGRLLVSGKTDEQGLFAEPIPRLEDPYAGFIAVAGEAGSERFGFSISSWGQNYALYEMGILLDTMPRKTEAYLYTDRPIYQPGDTIHFRAVIFDRENGQPQPTQLTDLTAQLQGDPGSSGIPITYFNKPVALSSFGTYAASVSLPAHAEPGMYHIDILHNDDVVESLYFDVAAYRKPDLEIEVSLSPHQSLAGTPLTAEIQADYYFGVPVSNHPFSWALYQEIASIDLPGYWVGPEDTAWLYPRPGDYSDLGKQIAFGEGQTDRQGSARIIFSPETLQNTEIEKGNASKYHLEVTLMDESGFPISYRDSAIVQAETYNIGIQPEAYYGIAGEPLAFSIQTVDWNNQVSGNQQLDARFESITWAYEETQDPIQPYRYNANTELVASASPITGSDGRARLSFTPPAAGTYRLTVSGGNAVTQVIVWVSGPGSAIWPRQAQNQIELQPDADRYQPGETAQIFLPNPLGKNAKALVAVERGTVMDAHIVALEGAGTTVSIPIETSSIPNIYVSVIILGKTDTGQPAYRQGTVNLLVDPREKMLAIDLVVDQPQSQPGDVVTATLTVKDHLGNPVQGEFSVAIVDKAVLALVDSNSPTMREALYGVQPLSVQTSVSIKTYAAQLALSTMDLGRGGGGDMSPVTNLRENFPDTALWHGQLITGVDGSAKLTFTLPDNLTTWVIDVRGLTEKYLVGQQETEIVVQKELMIEPVTPRFLVAGDQVEMAAVVYNTTSGSLEVDVSLMATGFSLSEEENQSQTISVDARSSRRVSWWGTADAVRTAELTFQAVSGNLRDTSKPVWGDLQIKRYQVPATFSTSGQLDESGSRMEVISLPRAADPNAGDLQVELTPSLTSVLFDALELLDGSGQQDSLSTVGRLVANLNAYQTLTQLDNGQVSTKNAYVDEINIAIRHLSETQNPDGSWDWWAGMSENTSDTTPFITAAILSGLQDASDAGFVVGDWTLDRARAYITASISAPEDMGETWQLNQAAFLLYVIQKDSLRFETELNSLYARRAELNPWSVALLALTLKDIPNQRDKVRTMLNDLETQAIRSSSGVHWESKTKDWRLPGSPAYNTAIVIHTLSVLDPATNSLMPAVRYLLSLRKPDGLWSSDFDSAWALVALTTAVQGTGDYQANFEFQAYLNDVQIATGAADGTDLLQAITIETPVSELYPTTPNTLVFRRDEGSGTLYYRTSLNVYQPVNSAEPMQQGLSLTREYYPAGEDCPEAEDCRPFEAVQLVQGELPQLVSVALTLTVAHDMHQLILKDFIPAGTEVFNQDFKTAQTLTETGDDLFMPRSPFRYGWGWWYFNKPAIYDDHLMWTVNYLPAGTYVLTYQLVPYQRGVYQTLPAQAWQYFFPEVQGTTGGSIFTID